MAQKTTRVGECHSVPIQVETEPSKYDLVVVLLALNPIRVYESIILLGTAGTEYGRLPWLALSASVLNACRQAASEGCHSIAQPERIMSDLQTSMGADMDPPDDCLSP
jgi:hypothetical protein